MPIDNPSRSAMAGNELSQELARLRNFTGAPAEFWPAFLAAAAAVVGAARGVLVLRDPKQPEQWKKLGDWNGNGHADRATLAFNNSLVDFAGRSADEGGLVQALESGSSPSGTAYAVTSRLQLHQSDQVAIAIFLVLHQQAAQAQEAFLRLRLIADIPASYQQTYLAQQARNDVQKFSSALDLLVLMNSEKRFLASTLALCNGIASHFQCDRVSLGWLEGGYIKLRTMSRTERFDRKMAAAKALEMAMEEAFDQDEEVVFPVLENSSVLTRDHEAFVRQQNPGNICSVPLRWENKPIAVLTCERQSRPFTTSELQQLRLIADQSVRQLSDLHRSDRWFGSRWSAAARERMGKWIGPENTWTKVLGLVVAVALVLMMLPFWPYRVEGNFILRSEDVSFLTSPFEGYISRVHVRPGDPVRPGAELLQLNTVDLELEEAAANADLTRFLREAEKSRAAVNLAEMRIAQALADQVRARLDLIRHRLDKATLKAPFEAIVVEGDLRQRVGAPVKQGDVLFKIARIDTLFVEAEINERDLHQIRDTSRGEIAFVSQPKIKYPVKITRIEPAAIPKNQGNIFLVRCQFEQKLENWWRPGMSGLLKLNVDHRSLLWILTHRTIDFLRLWLWW